MGGTKRCLPLLTSQLPGFVSRSSVRPERSPVFANSGFPATWSPRLGGRTETLKTTWVGDNLDTAAGFLCKAGVMWQKGHSQELSLGLCLS